MYWPSFTLQFSPFDIFLMEIFERSREFHQNQQISSELEQHIIAAHESIQAVELARSFLARLFGTANFVLTLRHVVTAHSGDIENIVIYFLWICLSTCSYSFFLVFNLAAPSIGKRLNNIFNSTWLKIYWIPEWKAVNGAFLSLTVFL